jgi:hypothetical protein
MGMSDFDRYELPVFDAGDEDQAWRAAAACRGIGHQIFYPGRGEFLDPAYAVCDCCTVTAECLASGMQEIAGVWGGTSRVERRRRMGQKGVKPRVNPRPVGGAS